MPLTSAHHTPLINPATVTYFNCGKDSYFILSYLEPKDIGNIKEIEEEEEEEKMSNRLEKEEP